MKKNIYYIGLMSGTSMDGVDVALVDVTTNKLIAGITCKYSQKAQDLLRVITTADKVTLAVLCQLNALLGREFATSALEILKHSLINISQITAIGSHGQTVCHDALSTIPYTLQLGCPHTIAELTGLTVVADFRTRDIVLGGQGAPFAPAYHQQIFIDNTEPLAVVNIGGIANVSYLNQGAATFGYDLGPGNCLMDAWIEKCLLQPFDADGAWGSTGMVNQELLANLSNDAFFSTPAPKSIGKEYFSLVWLEKFIKKNLKQEDVQATLRALTARSVAREINTSRLLICGGGVHNQALLTDLRALLPGCIVESTAACGIDPDYIEAMMFAWLAHQRLTNTAVDLTHITGARKSALLGAIYAGGVL